MGDRLLTLLPDCARPSRRMLHEDTCWTILYMYHHCDLSPETIATYVRTRTHPITSRSVYRVLDRFEETGEVRGTRPASMSVVSPSLLCDMIRKEPNAICFLSMHR